jgi:hypothetical protein
MRPSWTCSICIWRTRNRRPVCATATRQDDHTRKSGALAAFGELIAANYLNHSPGLPIRYRAPAGLRPITFEEPGRYAKALPTLFAP